MDLITEYLTSQNRFVEFFRESVPLVMAGGLLYNYYKGRISAMETIIYAFATEAYNMIMIGPTLTATFFISLVFLTEQFHKLFTGRLRIKQRFLLLLVLPLLSSLAVFFVIQLFKNPFYYPPGKMGTFYMRPLYFYFKTYLPLIALGTKIMEEKNSMSLDRFYTLMKRIAKVSMVLCVLQIISQLVFKSIPMGEVLGLQRRYMLEQSASLFSLRLQASFSEPKIYSAFLSLCIPLFMKDRQYWMAFFSFLLGVLTISQTFYINLLGAGIIFLVLGKLPSTRIKILGTLGLIIGLFALVSSSKEYFFKLYMKNQGDPVYDIIFKRSVNRYDNYDIYQKNNVVWGMPLQRDMELPIVDFVKHEPYLLVTGYGPGNSTFIPSEYFYGQLNYEDHVAGVGSHNLNMRWFYLAAEFGLIALVIIFYIFTQAQAGTTNFQSSYLGYAWVCFFFSQIDLLLVITALLTTDEPEPAPSPLNSSYASY